MRPFLSLRRPGVSARPRALALVLSMAAVLGGVTARAAEPSTWDRLRDYAADRKDDAVAEGRRLLGEADAKIAELKQKAAQSTGDVKAAHERNLKDLEQKKAAAAEKLESMKASSANAWDATKEGFANAADDLHQAWRKATSAAAPASSAR